MDVCVECLVSRQFAMLSSCSRMVAWASCSAGTPARLLPRMLSLRRVEPLWWTGLKSAAAWAWVKLLSERLTVSSLCTQRANSSLSSP